MFIITKIEELSISIHALLAESDVNPYKLTMIFGKFLSTLSLRRATLKKIQKLWNAPISIHALLAESDPPVDTSSVKVSISIHALLAESDPWGCFLLS